MKQLIQNFKTGELYIDEVPMPSISSGMVLVENEFSLISAGTERSTVKVAQANLIGKAKQRPDLVAQVLQNLKKEGLAATIGKVKTKLDSLKALGYSTSGLWTQQVCLSQVTGLHVEVRIMLLMLNLLLFLKTLWQRSLKM
jgi:polar amino acid transport system substrate-binding protein